MRDQPPAPVAKSEPTLAEQIGAKEVRKLKARRHAISPVWFGLGMMGLVGWSVVVPTLLGAALGLWVDRNHPSEHSWTLALLVAGLVLGCVNAWRWIDKEDKAMGEEQKNKEEDDIE